MKSILEQDFNELYAQVEERVKCIKPVKQMDTFTKALMWTSLNEILMDVFGGSRFMWMITTNDGDFTVMFFDKCKIIPTRNITVNHTNILKWPTEAELVNMSYDDLCEFKRLCRDNGITQVEICRRYSKSDSWFSMIVCSRKHGSTSRDSDAYKTKVSENRTSSWTDEELDNHLFGYELAKRQIPISRNILTQMLGDEKTAVRAALSSNAEATNCRAWLSRRDERYSIVLDKVLQYIELAIITVNTVPNAFNRQRAIKLSATTSTERRKQLIDRFENMKYAMEIEKRNLTINNNLKHIKEATNDRMDK